MDKTFSHKEAAKEKMLEALMEYAGRCYLDYTVDSVDVEKKRFYQENTFPHELDARMKKLIRYRKFRDDFLQACKKGSKVFAKVAMVLIIMGVSLGVLAATSEAARHKIINFAIEVEKEFTNIHFQHDPKKEDKSNESSLDMIPKDWSNVYIPSYIPEGFKIINTVLNSSAKTIFYANEEGLQITFRQYNSEKMELMIDTEDVQIERILINGVEGLISEKEGLTILVWHDYGNSFYLGSEIEREEIVKMAKNIRK